MVVPVCLPGLRPIANLGAATSVRLRGGTRPVTLGRKRGRRRPAMQLTFHPVNQQLQHLHQVIIFKTSASMHPCAPSPAAVRPSLFGQAPSSLWLQNVGGARLKKG